MRIDDALVTKKLSNLIKNKQNMFERVLVPVDFSECSNQLVKNLPKLINEIEVKKVYLVKVINTFKFVGVSSGFDFTTWLRDEELKTKNKLKEFIDYLTSHGIDAEFISPIPIGDPVSEIMKVIDNLKISLVILGTRGKSVFKEILLGSVSEGILRLSKVPVMLFRCKLEKINEKKMCTLLTPDKIFEKIIYAHDLTENSEKVKNCLLKIKNIDKSEIILLHVIESRDVNLNDVETRLKDVAKTIKAKNVKILIKFGSPHREILKVASDEKATLIAMGSRGIGFLESLIIGSTSETVARYTEKPLLVCKG